MSRALAIGLITLFLTHAAWALYGISFGNEPVQNGNWPAGTADLANLPGRYATATGDPGNSIFAYHGDTAAFQAAVDLLGKITATDIRLVVHGGANPNSMFAGGPAPNSRPKEDWTFTVYNPDTFNRWKQFAGDRLPPVPPSPSMDLYLAKDSKINFPAIQVPANIKFVDERSGTAGSVIGGQVLDIPSSKPIADALVVLEKNNKDTHKYESVKQIRSNADGAFEFKDLPPDSYRLKVSANDHVTRVADYIQVLESTFKQTTVQLSPVTKITGKVIDNDGAAVVGASVRGSSSTATDKTDYRQPEDVAPAITDAQGNFSLSVPQGASLVRATLDGYFQVYSREATTAPSDAVTIRMTKTGTIKGTVVDGQGNPALGDAMIRIMGSPDPIGRWGGNLSMMADGKFEFKNVPPGEYLVSTGPSPDVAHDPNAKKIEVKIGQTTEITIEQHARVSRQGMGSSIRPIR